jgi:dimethylargininase
MSSRFRVFDFDSAIVRAPAASVVDGLRAGDRGSPSYDGVLAEHRAYVAALEAAGVAVTRLDPLPEFPDSLFVEDPALVFTEGAIVLRPGAESRAGETRSIAPILQQRFAQVLEIDRGHVDGGDVLTLPDRVMIGLSARTDRAGAQALIDCLSRLGRRGEIVETPANVLHFKSDSSLVDGATVLCTARLAASGVFRNLRQILVPAGEEAAANVLRVNETVLAGACYPGTIALLRDQGFAVVPLPTAEIAKIDAGLSCMSLRWHSSGAAAR